MWKKKLPKTKPNVGLVWTGSLFGPNQPLRSIQLKNITKIFELNNVHGALIGGSSLKFKDFLAIYKSAVKQII